MLFIHIGVGRTGSTALQRYFAEQSAELNRQGIFYRETPPVARARRGEITSGNGMELFCRAFPEYQGGKQPYDKGILRDVVAAYEGPGTGFVSCEYFAFIPAVCWRRLSGLGCDIRLIAYIRNPVDSLWSAYQRNRSGGYVNGTFREFLDTPAGDYQSAYALRTATDIFNRDRLSVFRYEDHEYALERPVNAVLEVDLPPMSRDRMNASEGHPSESDAAYIREREAENVAWLEALLGQP